jgi:flagellin-like protein
MRHKGKRGMSKRGISTVVASILVLAITVALAVGLLTFGSSFMASQQKMQPPTTDQIKIENVYFDTQTTVQVTIRNIGTGSVNVTDIYVGGFHYSYASLAGAGSFAPVAPASSGVIASGKAVTFEVTRTLSQGNWNSGTAYTIMAATGNGGQNTYTATYT